MAPLMLVILSEILAFVIGFLLVCPQGITDFAENDTWYQISELNDRHFKKSRKSGNFCKLLKKLYIAQENYTEGLGTLRNAFFRIFT